MTAVWRDDPLALSARPLTSTGAFLGGIFQSQSIWRARNSLMSDRLIAWSSVTWTATGFSQPLTALGLTCRNR